MSLQTALSDIKADVLSGADLEESITDTAEAYGLRPELLRRKFEESFGSVESLLTTARTTSAENPYRAFAAMTPYEQALTKNALAQFGLPEDAGRLCLIDDKRYVALCHYVYEHSPGKGFLAVLELATRYIREMPRDLVLEEISNDGSRRPFEHGTQATGFVVYLQQHIVRWAEQNKVKTEVAPEIAARLAALAKEREAGTMSGGSPTLTLVRRNAEERAG